MTETPTIPAHAPGQNHAAPEPAGRAATAEPAREPVRPRVQLFDRMDGTWFRPAPFSKVDLCVDFWNAVEIPEGLADEFQEAYGNAVTEEVTAAVNEVMVPWGEGWIAANPKPKREKDHAEYEARFTALFNEKQDAVRAEQRAKHPEMAWYDVSQLLRATQMLRFRPYGPYAEEGDRIFDEYVELYEETVTIEQVEQKYRLSRLWPLMRQAPLPAGAAAVVGAIEGLSGKIDALHTELNSARGTLIDILDALD